MAISMSVRRRRITMAAGAAVAIAAGATLLTLPAGAAPAEGTVYGAGVEGSVQGSYVVMLKDSQGVQAASDGKDLAKQYGGKVNHTYHSAIKGFSTKGMSAKQARQLAANSRVAKVVQSHRFTIDGTQTNPPSWGLDRIDQKTTKRNKKYAFPSSGGRGATAYVIDTGIRITHKDFGGRAKYGFDAVDGDTKANDGNGHGTHVAGTIGGTKYGVAKKTKIVAVRVLNKKGSGTTEQVIAGIDWVTKHHKGPSVANLSLGGPRDEAVDEAVSKAIESGVTFSVAAGNEAQNANTSSPARLPEAITVAASDKRDKQAEYSNFGKVVDLFAPGTDIVSASSTSNTATKTLSGTSMATPHVAGAAAVYLGAHRNATPEEVSAGLTGAATPGVITNPTNGTPNKLLRVTAR